MSVEIARAVIEHKARSVESWPCRSNRASEAGHSCERYLVYCRTNWQDRRPISGETKCLFEGGEDIEARSIRNLQDAGFEVVEQQRAFDWPEYQVTGHIDAKVRVDGTLYPWECKGLQQWDYEKLNPGEDGCFHLEDFLGSAKPWIRKYPAQLMLYMLMGNIDRGIFYIVSKLSYVPKSGWLLLDYEYAESVLQRMERVNAHIEAGTLPDQTNDIDLCERCDFFNLCLPEMKRNALSIEDDPELEGLISRWFELEPSNRERNALDKTLKKRLEGVERAVIGDYIITGKLVHKQAYEVSEKEYWQKSIKRIEAGGLK